MNTDYLLTKMIMSSKTTIKHASVAEDVSTNPLYSTNDAYMTKFSKQTMKLETSLESKII